MRGQFALKVFSTFIVALMALTLVALNAAQAAGKWDGEWVWKTNLNINPNSGCIVNIKFQSVRVENDQLIIRLKDGQDQRDIKAGIDRQGFVSKWQKFDIVSSIGGEPHVEL